jgi:CBS domain-containing protein
MAGKTDSVSVIRSDVRVQDVIDKLEDDHVGALVVSDDHKSVQGIISGGDIVRGLKQFGRDVVDRPIGDLMTRTVICCDIGEPMSRIYELMDKHQIRYVPITANGKLFGIINMLDVVKYRLEEIKTEAEALKDYVAGRV